MADNKPLGNLSDFIKTESTDEVSSATTTVEEELSPLERMKREKAKGTGLILDNKDITRDSDTKEFKSSFDNEDRAKNYDEYIAEQERLIRAAQDVRMTRPPQNPLEEAALIDQLDVYSRQKEGLYVDDPKDTDGNVIKLSDSEKNPTPINLSGIGVTFNDNKTVGTDEGFIKENNPEETAAEEAKAESSEEKTEEDPEEAKKKAEKDNLVKVLIDKTGLGLNDIKFTDEERQKLTVASEIRVTEVENLDLETLTFTAPSDSYMDTLVADENIAGTTMVPLVASRYRAKMRGVGYAQLGDLILNQQSPSFEQYNKRYSTIYNNIVSTTVGKFESYEDFLKRTAYVDMDMLLYGLIVSTYPEVDEVGIPCPSCNRYFEQKYFVRELMDLKFCNDEYLAKLDEFMKVTPDKYQEYHNDGPVHKRQYIRLPKSGYIAEIGLASAYDYLFTIIQNLTDEEFIKRHPDDINGMLQFNAIFLAMIRSMAIPDKANPKKATKYDSFEDIIQIIYRMPLEDTQILMSLVAKYNDTYQVTFSIKNVTCPHCHTVHESTDVDLNNLVFFKFHRSASTETNVSNIHVL